MARSASRNPYLSTKRLGESTQIRQFLIDHYFLNVAPIFAIFDGPENPLGDALRQYLTARGVLCETIVSISALHLANTHGDDNIMQHAFNLRSGATQALRAELDKERRIYALTQE